MTRPQFFLFAIACSVFVRADFLHSGFLYAGSLHPGDRPNVVVIISDDQTYSDFGFMGNSDVHTPNLDQLAQKSARYINGYVPSSVCRPSLVSILTGLYPHQHKVHFNHPPPGFAKLTKNPAIGKQQFDAFRQKATRFVRDVPTLPRALAKSGYRCFQTGKYWEGHYRNAGFTDGMTLAQPSGGKNGDKQLAGGDVVAHGNGDHGLAIGRETMKPIDDFLDGCGEQPFFLWYAPFLPHTPHDSPRKYFDLYNGSGRVKSIAKHKAPYYASIAHFDDTVGSLIESVRKRGLSENTIFIFVVDNGWTPDANRYVSRRGEWDHTKNSKRAPFDSGLRTPILICWDGHVKPAEHKGLVSSIDIMPTCLDACRIEDGFQLPGISLLPSASGKAQLDPDRAVFGGVYPGDASELDRPDADIAYRWVRHGQLKLIVPHSHDGKPAWGGYLDKIALFNVEEDPAERNDLVDRPEHQADIARLLMLLDQWWRPRK